MFNINHILNFLLFPCLRNIYIYTLFFFLENMKYFVNLCNLEIGSIMRSDLPEYSKNLMIPRDYSERGKTRIFDAV